MFLRSTCPRASSSRLETRSDHQAESSRGQPWHSVERSTRKSPTQRQRSPFDDSTTSQADDRKRDPSNQRSERPLRYALVGGWGLGVGGWLGRQSRRAAYAKAA